MSTINGPRISVITVCYNAADKIDITIASVLGQTYRDIEYIIVDGASTDGTLEKVKKYDRELIWSSEPDTGVYDAMNKGVERATGDWIYFLGAGDIMLDVLNELVPAFSDPRCIYYGDVFRHDIHRRYDGRFSAFKLAVTNICHQAIFYPRAVFEKYKYNLDYPAMADHHLNMLCFGDKDFKLHYLPALIAEYEGNGFSANNADSSFLAHKLKLVKHNFPLPVYWYVRLRNMFGKVFKH